MPTRLNKYISDSGICSRREADRYIEQGSVLVNGKKAQVGDQVTARDRVLVNGNLLEARAEEDLVYIVFNKPPGVVSTTETGVRDNIIRAVKHSVRLFPVGGLDKELQGLIMLTSDGELVNRLLRAGNAFEKEYVVMVDKPLTELFLQALRDGVALSDNTHTEPAAVSKETPYIFRTTLQRELNHQLERVCAHFGYAITQAERIRVLNIPLKGIGIGEWRELKDKEAQALLALADAAPTARARVRRRPAARPQEARPAGPPRPNKAASTSSARPTSATEKKARPTAARPSGAGKAGRPAASPKGRPSGRGTRGAGRGGKRG